MEMRIANMSYRYAARIIDPLKHSATVRVRNELAVIQEWKLKDSFR